MIAGISIILLHLLSHKIVASYGIIELTCIQYFRVMVNIICLMFESVDLVLSERIFFVYYAIVTNIKFVYAYALKDVLNKCSLKHML